MRKLAVEIALGLLAAGLLYGAMPRKAVPKDCPLLRNQLYWATTRDKFTSISGASGVEAAFREMLAKHAAYNALRAQNPSAAEATLVSKVKEMDNAELATTITRYMQAVISVAPPGSHVRSIPKPEGESSLAKAVEEYWPFLLAQLKDALVGRGKHSAAEIADLSDYGVIQAFSALVDRLGCPEEK